MSDFSADLYTQFCCCPSQLPSSSTTDSAYSLEGLDHGNVTTPSIPFPTLNEAAINSAIARYRDKQGGGGSGEGGEEEEDEEEDRHLGMRCTPSHHHTFTPSHHHTLTHTCEYTVIYMYVCCI